MLIAGFDLAVRTGFAVGRPGAVPRSGVVRLKKPDQDLEVAARNLADLRQGAMADDYFVFVWSRFCTNLESPQMNRHLASNQEEFFLTGPIVIGERARNQQGEQPLGHSAI